MAEYYIQFWTNPQALTGPPIQPPRVIPPFNSLVDKAFVFPLSPSLPNLTFS
jgi:hypothetical protein